MIKLKGVVTSGIGDFSKKMEQIPGLLDAYERKLGVRFFPGTLNIKLNQEYSVPSNSLRLEKEEYSGSVSVNIVPAKLNGKSVYILRMDKNEKGEGVHPKTIIEIAADEKLRDRFSLEDGDILEIII